MRPVRTDGNFGDSPSSTYLFPYRSVMAADPEVAPVDTVGNDPAQLRAEIAGLREALTSRAMIGQAVGMLMERYKVDATQAWNVLIRTSQNRNVKVRDLAAQMTADPTGQDAYPEKATK
jgi:hypothetical protein